MKKAKSVNDMFLDWAKKNNVDEKRAKNFLEPQRASVETYELVQNAIRIQKAKKEVK